MGWAKRAGSEEDCEAINDARPEVAFTHVAALWLAKEWRTDGPTECKRRKLCFRSDSGVQGSYRSTATPGEDKDPIVYSRSKENA